MAFEQSRFEIGDWAVDPIGNIIEKNKQTIKLERRLIRVLIQLASHPERGVSREHLLETVWEGKEVSEQTITVAISHLRRVMGCNAKNPIYIETITGYGFRLVAPVSIQSGNPQVSSNAPLDNIKLEEGVGAVQPSLFQFAKIRNLNIRAPSTWLIFITAIIAALTLGYWLGSDKTRDWRQDDLVNNELYGKARFLMQQDNTNGELAEAEALLGNLAKLYPNNPKILNELGKSIFFSVYKPPYELPQHRKARAKDLFHQAVELDPQLGDAYLQLSLLNFYGENNFKLALEQMQTAISLTPDDHITHEIAAGYYLALRDFDKAIHHVKLAANINVLNYGKTYAAWVYTMAEDFQNAKRELAKLYTLNPDSSEYHSSALRIYELMGMEEQAAIHYFVNMERIGYSETELTQAQKAFSGGGLKALNLWLAEEKNEKGDIGQGIGLYAKARYYVAAGEHDKAFRVLYEHYDKAPKDLIFVNADPKYAPLRDDPRFKQLLSKIGFHSD